MMYKKFLLTFIIIESSSVKYSLELSALIVQQISCSKNENIFITDQSVNFFELIKDWSEGEKKNIAQLLKNQLLIKYEQHAAQPAIDWNDRLVKYYKLHTLVALEEILVEIFDLNNKRIENVAFSNIYASPLY